MVIADLYTTSSKFKTKKISIILRFYFYKVLEQLQNNTYTNFPFEQGLCFVMYSTLEFLSFCVTQYLDGGRQTCQVDKKKTYFAGFFFLNSHFIRKGTTLMFTKSLGEEFTLQSQKSVTDVSVGFRPPCWSPSGWTPTWRLLSEALLIQGNNLLECSAYEKSH